MKRLWLLVTVLTAMSFAVILYATSGDVSPISKPPAASSQETSTYRVIGTWRGRVAVFLPEKDTPETVYDTAVSSLPMAEQERLAVGVEAKNEAALRRLLEAYLS